MNKKTSIFAYMSVKACGGGGLKALADMLILSFCLDGSPIFRSMRREQKMDNQRKKGTSSFYILENQS